MSLPFLGLQAVSPDLSGGSASAPQHPLPASAPPNSFFASVPLLDLPAPFTHENSRFSPSRGSTWLMPGPRIDLCGSEGSAAAPRHTVNHQQAWLGVGHLPLSPLTRLLLTIPGVSHLGVGVGRRGCLHKGAGRTWHRQSGVCTSHTEEAGWAWELPRSSPGLSPGPGTPLPSSEN